MVGGIQVKHCLNFFTVTRLYINNVKYVGIGGYFMSSDTSHQIRVWEPVFVHWSQNPVGINVNGKLKKIKKEKE